MSEDGAYRVFCAYPKSCGAQTFVETENYADYLVEQHEKAHNGQHAADYERWEDAE